MPARAPATRREAKEMAAAATARARRSQTRPSSPRSPLKAGGLLLGLMLLVAFGLVLAPILADPPADRQPLWVGLLLGLVAVVGAPVVVHRLIRGFRTNLLLLSGLLLWAVGLMLISAMHVMARPDLPGPGHPLLLLGIPFVVQGLGRTEPRRQRRPFSSALLTLDAVMMACAWLGLLWVLRLQDLHWNGSPLLLLVVLAGELIILMVLLILLSDSGSALIAVAAAAVLTVTIGDVLEAVNVHSLGGTQTSGAASSLLLVVAWLLVTGSVVRLMEPGRRAGTQPPQTRWRSLVTLSNVLIPLGFTFGLLAADGFVDRITLLLTGVVVLVVGVRELVRAGQAQELVDLLASQALRDPLTGLGNRRALAERLGPLTDLPGPVCVLTLDVDRFKMVNTQFGHSTGDFVLTAVGTALRDTCARVGAQPFRLGGDEFAIIVAGDLQVGLELADRVRSAVQSRVNEVPGVENIALTSSVGVAQVNLDCQPSDDPLQVLARSAEALRVAKQERNRVRAYSEDLAVETDRRTRMESRLRLAIDNGAISFHYQPVVDMRSGRVLGLESLARWRDPELGDISPADFVAVAEQTGLIHALGHAAMDNALRVATWLARSGTRLHVAVNVSPLQLRRDQFIEELFDLVRRHDAHLSMLRLEVTEGIFMDADDPAVATLRTLAASGVGIAIDDFGSGYSSLGYMSRLPVDTVKVDRSLTVQITDARTRSVVKALLWVAESHGLQVILEGVENEQTAATLRRLGVRRGQGWLWSGAVTEQDLPLTLRVLGTVPERSQQVRPGIQHTPRTPQRRVGDVIRLP